MRLPDISYGGDPRALAKEDPGIAAKKAQVEIDLSKAQLGADLDKESAIGQANIRLAREMGAVDRDKAWSQAQINIDAFNQKSKINGMKFAANMQLASTAISLAGSAFDSWYQAGQESKAAAGAATYSKNMSELTAKLTSSPTINLDEFPDVDFSQIPESMIYEGVDEVTGQKIRTAPNHVAAPLVYAAAEPKIRELAAKGIDSRLANAKFNNAIAQDDERHTLAIITSKAKHEREFLQGQYATAINTRKDMGDLPGALQAIDSAEARGVYSADEAAKQRKTLQSDIKYVHYMKAIDGATDIGSLNRIQESTVNLPKEDQTLVRAKVASKVAAIERIEEKRRVEQERAVTGLRTVQASNVAIAGGGLQDYESGRQAIIKEYAKTDPAHLDNYLRAWDSRYSGIQTHIKQQKEAVQANWYKDPTQPIPAEFDGKDLVEAEKYQVKVLSGEPITTHMPTFVALERMSAENPAAFAKVNLDTYRGSFDDSDMKHFSTKQSRVIAGKEANGQIESAHAVFDNAAKQAFGVKYDKNKADAAKADAVFHAYTVMVEETAEAKGKPLTTSELQTIANDVFRTKLQSHTTSYFSNTRRPTEVKLSDREVSQYVPAITNMLKAAKVPVTPQNIIKEYNYRLLKGTLEELEF